MTASGGGAVILISCASFAALKSEICGSRLNFRMVLI